MARLGELLVAARMLTADQVERALQAQVLWGGRLGTNLVELGHIDLDSLTRALGRQHNMPAALARHFDKADPELQRRLEPAQVDAWRVVPLLRVGGGKLAIASMDPIGRGARAELAAALAVVPEELVISIAAEQRVRYQLERVYGIARSARFLRTRGQNITPFPQLGEVPVPVESDPDIRVEAAPPPEAVPEPIPHREIELPPAEDLAALLEDAIARAATVPVQVPEPAGRERRTYVRTLGDADAPATLGRIAIKKVAPSAVSGPGKTLLEATRAIKRGPDRDKVAALVIDAIDRFVPACDAAMMMIVRGDIAIGWKWFTRSGHVPPELAVPMKQEGLVPDVVASNQTARCAGDKLGAIDLLLLRSLGKADGDLVIVPVPIAGKVMCVLATALEDNAPAHVIESVATAASAAFARLVRDASR
jgi:hypothetical protein